jgi:hypothetical protein
VSWTLARITGESRRYLPELVATAREPASGPFAAFPLQALRALALLGPEAAPAWPDLLDILCDRFQTLEQQQAALKALLEMSPAASTAAKLANGLSEALQGEGQGANRFP